MKLKFLVVSSLMFSVYSCKNDEAAYRQAILGSWDVYASEMNGKPNDFMKNGYFIFTADNLVTSNTIPENQSSAYSVKKDKLEIDGIDDFNMHIIRLDKDTLWLKGKISYYDMKYVMVRRQ